MKTSTKYKLHTNFAISPKFCNDLFSQLSKIANDSLQRKTHAMDIPQQRNTPEKHLHGEIWHTKILWSTTDRPSLRPSISLVSWRYFSVSLASGRECSVHLIGQPEGMLHLIGPRKKAHDLIGQWKRVLRAIWLVSGRAYAPSDWSVEESARSDWPVAEGAPFIWLAEGRDCSIWLVSLRGCWCWGWNCRPQESRPGGSGTTGTPSSWKKTKQHWARKQKSERANGGREGGRGGGALGTRASHVFQCGTHAASASALCKKLSMAKI